MIVRVYFWFIGGIVWDYLIMLCCFKYLFCIIYLELWYLVVVEIVMLCIIFCNFIDIYVRDIMLMFKYFEMWLIGVGFVFIDVMEILRRYWVFIKCWNFINLYYCVNVLKIFRCIYYVYWFSFFWSWCCLFGFLVLVFIFCVSLFFDWF